MIPSAEVTPRWLWVFAFAGVLVGVLVTLTLRAPRCHDAWDYEVGDGSGQCPAGAYVAEHPEISGGVLVVCRCRPEPRTYAPESRP